MTDRYVDHGNGTVTDTQTGLMWEQSPSNQCRTHAEAVAYCTRLQLGEHADWRLPTVQELISLVDYTRYDPAIDPIFTTVAYKYWSATTGAGYPGYAWFVSFDNGFVGYNYSEDYNGYVRAVRAGSSNIRSFDMLKAENTQLQAHLAQCRAVLRAILDDCNTSLGNIVWPPGVAVLEQVCRALADLPDAPKGQP